MTSKFEQLIEYVINDEEAKAKELFHDIVVEKSREIYENLMQEETEEIEESADEDLDEGLEGVDSFGGDASQEFMDEVETEEEGMMEADDEEIEIDGEIEGSDHHDDMGGNEELEDRVVDLEDKLDELMAEFEDLMGSEGNSDMGVSGGDELEMDDTEEFDDGTEGEEEFELAEGIDLKAAPKPTTSEEGSVNKKAAVAANSGARGAMAQPVRATGTEAKGRPAPGTKDLISDFQNKAGTGMKNQSAAPKPVTTQAAGVNARTPFPKG
jgi:hypothetical protein